MFFIMVLLTGLHQPVLFFNHKNKEVNDDFSKTHSNLFEARMIKELAAYLLMQDYKPSEITIITMYSGQLFLLRKLMPKEKFEGIKITTVDNFQGTCQFVFNSCNNFLFSIN